MGAALTGCGPMTFVINLTPSNQRLTTTVVKPADRWFSSRVAIIDVTGTIRNTAKSWLALGDAENPVSLLHEQLQMAQQDPRVKAVILRLNTPGGTVTASEAMYRMIDRFKQQSEKPVVALMMDVAASGGYYLACSADQIIAYPTSITGSIGVIVQTVSLKPALNRIGVHAEAITTGPNKDAGSPLSNLTDDHRAVIRNLVDDFYQRFLDVVRHARPDIPPDQFAQATDGRVFTGQQAADLKLVDQLGDLDDAFELAKNLADIHDAQLVRYHRPHRYVGSPYAADPLAPPAANPHGTQINLAQINLAGSLDQPRLAFYYLWQTQLP